jgi:urea transport system permease protein
VPQVGIINPSEMSPANSIEIAIWVAVGGRGTLVGAVLGAGIVNLAKSWFTVSFPEYWPFFLGFLFIAVTLYLPDGVVGLWRRLRGRTAPRDGAEPEPGAASPAAGGAALRPAASAAPGSTTGPETPANGATA